MTERDIYFDASGHPLFPKGFDFKKAERIMGNYMRHFSNSHFTFAEVASLLILAGTGYDVVKALEDISRLADDYDLLHESFVDHDGNVVFVD